MNKYNIENLTLQEKLGQLIVFGFDALDVNEHAVELIKKYKAGNIILFARNVQTPEQLYKLNQNLQQLAQKEIGIPLLITIDQEGGMVTRIKNGATFFPGAMTITATSDKNNSYLTGKYMGEELKALGINMNLAPTLDVNNNPYNPVIGVRSFSDNPIKVADFGCEYVRGMQESVIATAKHFPGHGDTKVDSHLALPKIDKTLKELENVELIPFKKAIDNGIKAIMSSHINFPALTENGKPCTLSKNVLTNLLRNELGFEGLIITDCMQMKAIQKHYTTKEGVLMAIEAGANLACISHSQELQIEAIKRLNEAAMSGELDQNIIDERVSRVLMYKENLEVDYNGAFESIKDIVINANTKDFSKQVVQKGMTLIKGNNVTLHKKTLLIASDPISTTIADEDDGTLNIIDAIHENALEVDTYLVSIRLTDDEINTIIEKSKKYDQVIFCSYNANIYDRQLELMKQLETQENELYVIQMRNPYDLVFVNELSNVLSLYEYTPNSIQVLIDYLKGTFVPTGKLPVTL